MKSKVGNLLRVGEGGGVVCVSKRVGERSLARDMCRRVSVRRATWLVPRLAVSRSVSGQARGGLRCPWSGKHACPSVDLRQFGVLCRRAGVLRESEFVRVPVRTEYWSC